MSCAADAEHDEYARLLAEVHEHFTTKHRFKGGSGSGAYGAAIAYTETLIEGAGRGRKRERERERGRRLAHPESHILGRVSVLRRGEETQDGRAPSTLAHQDIALNNTDVGLWG
ncbi:hypothetical protein DL764_002781 [Monosporascus ibericus]|uniref:Uncharacterized protein n=1 Tax=Monosporascus ibericus TaxID=155417 RepID=A0A4Q4TKT9_9PEZI|nr:hypothetical protein DL764_002781 [Monosporascus ibericus]